MSQSAIPIQLGGNRYSQLVYKPKFQTIGGSKMPEVKVISNYHPRDLMYLWEFSEEQQKYIKSEYDWLDNPEDHQFFMYRGDIYCLDDFIAVHNTFHNPNPPEWMKSWDGYKSDSFFSGIVIRLVNDDFNERVIVGLYLS